MDEPSRQEWQELFSAAVAFRDLAPWDWMRDSDTVGVRDPESGQIGYCVVMGRLGEHFGLACYRGSEGLDLLWRMRDEKQSKFAADELQRMDCVTASFEDRDQLDKEDLALVRSLSLRFRGRSAWPFFRSYRPGFVPWHLTSHEARFLAAALEQTSEVALRLAENPRLLPAERREGPYLVRVMQENGTAPSWRDALLPPAPLPKQVPVQLPVELADEAGRLAHRLPRSETVLELDAFVAPAPVRGPDDERPWLPLCLMVMDTRSHLIVGAEMVRGDELASAAPGALLSAAQAAGAVPSAVLVSRPEVYRLLKPLADRLGTEVLLVDALHMVNEARAELQQYMVSGAGC